MSASRVNRTRVSLRTFLIAATCVAAWMFGSTCQAWWCECCGMYLGPPGISPLDTPLRPYYVPRCPAWGEHCFKYRVAPQCHGGPNGGPCENSAACGGGENGSALSPELAETFAPYGFERIGQIPNDGILPAMGAPPR